MRMLLTLFVISLATATFGQIPDFDWANSVNTSNFYDYASPTSIVTDNNGNVYTVGSFEGTIDFDPGSGVLNLTSQYLDIYVQKLDPAGNLLWAMSFGTSSFDLGHSITADNNGNVIFTGEKDGELVIHKLDASGNSIWEYTISGPTGLSISSDHLNNIYVTGTFQGSVNFGAGMTISTSASVNDIFAAKLDASGNFVWVKSLGGVGLVNDPSIAVDDAGDIYIIGNDDDLSGGPTLSFIRKYNSAGNQIWDTFLSGVSISGLTVNSSDIYLKGSFNGTVDLDPSLGVMEFTSLEVAPFIIKLNNIGEFGWAKSFDYNIKIGSISCNNNSDLFVTGYFSGSNVNFNPDGSYNLSASGFTDIFVEKLDVQGEFEWVYSLGSTGINEGVSIIVNSNSLLVTGQFKGTVDFDPGANTFNLISTHNSCFIQKLTLPPTGTRPITAPSTVQIFPNPTSNRINIKGLNNQTKTILLRDIRGRVIKKTVENGSELEMDIPGPKGIYTVEIIFDDTSEVLKVLKL